MGNVGLLHLYKCCKLFIPLLGGKNNFREAFINIKVQLWSFYALQRLNVHAEFSHLTYCFKTLCGKKINGGS